MSRWKYVINGFIALLFIGCSYAWSVFIVPLEQTFGWARSETSLAFTLNIILYAAGSMAAGVLAKRLSYSVLMKIAAVMIGAGFCLTSFVTQPWQVYLTYSLLCGCGIGIGYNCVVSAVPRWFPSQTGFVSGILLVGYAMSTAIFGPALSSLISATGIAATFRILAALCLTALLLTSFLLKVPTAQQEKSLPTSKQAQDGNGKDVTPSRMVKMPVFWVDMILTVFLSGCGLTLINHISPMMTEGLGTTAAVASLVISINSIMNAGGRILGGILYDKKGAGLVMPGIPLFMTGAFVLLYISLQTGSIPLCVAGSGLVLFAFGANANMIPTLVRELFGEKNFSLNYPIVNINSVGAAFVPTLIGALQSGSGGYQLPVLALLVFSVISLGLTMLLLKLKSEK